MTSNDERSSAECPSFEDSLRSLEQIVHDLEEGRLGLADSLARYEEGIKLLKQCFSLLEHAERRIELLAGVDAAGSPITAPFDDQATQPPSDSAQSPRPRRKQSKSQPQTPPERPPAAAGMDEPGSLF